MRHALLTAALAPFLAALLAVPAALAGQAGDLVMADRGPWTLPDGAIVWDMVRAGPAQGAFRPVPAGSLTLQPARDDSGAAVVELDQKAPGQNRRIGPFPVAGGDPVVVYFLENTVRDMAELTGGSPYYIRNRVKDALFRGGEVVPSATGQTVILRPFDGDPNAARMGAFSSLTLRFEVPRDPRQPIPEMVAETTAPAQRPAASVSPEHTVSVAAEVGDSAGQTAAGGPSASAANPTDQPGAADASGATEQPSAIASPPGMTDPASAADGATIEPGRDVPTGATTSLAKGAAGSSPGGSGNAAPQPDGASPASELQGPEASAGGGYRYRLTMRGRP